MSDFPPPNNRFGEQAPSNLEFAPVQPIEIEPSFAGSTGLRNDLDSSFTGSTGLRNDLDSGFNTGATTGRTTGSNNPFSGDIHSGQNSGFDNNGLSSGLSNNSAYKPASTTGTHTGTHTGVNTGNSGANAAQTVVDSLPSKETVINSASSAANTIKNHPITQNAINHPITQNAINGPVATSVKDEAYRTSNEFANLAASRAPPNTYAATGQPLTHYHSFFTTLLSWNNPRASGLAYAAIVVFIFAARYLHILRYAFKLTWVTLGITVLAELAGQTVLSTGLTSQFRPRKYFTIPKSTLNAVVGDVHELINFFVIEAQRIVFVENLLISGAAFVAAFISYFLIKVVPFWGLTLIGTSVIFLGPLVYKSNKQLIDEQLQRAANLANQQAEQTKKIASEQAARAIDTTKQVVGDYSSKAQELIGTANAKVRSVSPTSLKNDAVNTAQNASNTVKNATNNAANTLKDTTNNNNNSSIKNNLTQKHTSGGVSHSNAGPDYPVVPRDDFVTDVPSSNTFPVAPQNDFSARPVGETASFLRKDPQPL